MFVRIRHYDREGWRGSFKRVEYRSGIPVGIYARSHAKPPATHYTVIESVRTDIGPRQKIITSWLDNPSLSSAIADLRKKIEQSENDLADFHDLVKAEASRNKGFEYTRKYPRLRRYREQQSALTRLKKQLSKLEYVFSVIGDWTDEKTPRLEKV